MAENRDMAPMGVKIAGAAAAIKECESILDFFDAGSRPSYFKSLPGERQWLLAVDKWGFEGNEGMLEKAQKNLSCVCPAAAEKASGYLEKLAEERKAKLEAFNQMLSERRKKSADNADSSEKLETGAKKPGSRLKPGPHPKKISAQTIIPYESWRR